MQRMNKLDSNKLNLIQTREHLTPQLTLIDSQNTDAFG